MDKVKVQQVKDENMEAPEVDLVSDDDDVVVLPQEEEEEEHEPPPIATNNVISASSSPSKKYTVLETRLHHSTNLKDKPLNSVTFEDCHSLAEFYENCKNKREYPLSGVGGSITLAPKRVETDNANNNANATTTTTKGHVNVTKFWYLSLRFATKFGHHITSLEVKIGNGVEFPTMFWQVLNKLLRFLPNLRSLFIEASFRQFGGGGGGGANMLLPQLNSIDHIRCPTTLTKLTFLGVRFSETNILTKMMTEKLMEAYGGQLRKLSVTQVTFDMIGKGALEKMRNLKELNLFWWRGAGGGGQDVRTSVLNKVEGMRAPELEKLRVMLNNTGFGTVRHPMWIFKLLERFPGLKVLNLSGVQFDEDRPSRDEGEEEGGSVKWEEMEGNGGLECLKFKDRRDVRYDFLGRLKGLEALFIEGAEKWWLMMKGEGVEEGIKLQEYLYGKQVFKSNIWEKMPRLRVIGVQCPMAPGGGGEEAGSAGGCGVEEMEEIYKRESKYQGEKRMDDDLDFF